MIAADEIVIDAIRSVAAGFIFTTSMSPVTCAGALAAVKYLREHDELRVKHQERASELRNRLIKEGIPVMSIETHIVPVLVGDAKKCKEISDRLLNDYDIYVQPINYPTVPVGMERLRIAPTPLHTDGMIDDLVNALKEVKPKTLVEAKDAIEEMWTDLDKKSALAKSYKSSEDLRADAEAKKASALAKLFKRPIP